MVQAARASQPEVQRFSRLELSRRNAVVLAIGAVLLAARGGSRSASAVDDSGSLAGASPVASGSAGASSTASGSAPTLVIADAGTGSDGGSGSSAVDAGPCMPNLTGRLRDFVNKPGFMPASALDNDFQSETADDRGLVLTDLGADLKPVYAHGTRSTATTHGQSLFDLWYRDSPQVNIPFDYTLQLVTNAGVQTFDDQEFFPLDGRGWNDQYRGDDGNMHNFSFTFELHSTFAYRGGETFTFTGDDDVFVFIAKKLVVDLGGVHDAETKTIALDSLVTDDSVAAPVPLRAGTTYPFDIFYNERHTVSSHFRMDTSIGFNNCEPIVVPK